MFLDDDQAGPEKDVLVVSKAKAAPKAAQRVAPIAPAEGRSNENVDCRHCDAGHVPDALRGSNETHRWLTCRPCNRRMVTQRRRNAAQGWGWIVISALYTQYGDGLRKWMMYNTKVETASRQWRLFSADAFKPRPRVPYVEFSVGYRRS